MNRVAAAVIGVCVVLGLAAAGWGYRRQEDTLDRLARQDAAIAAETEARERQSCDRANEQRGDLRRAFSDVLTENLIEAARTPPPPEVVEGYRAGLLEDLEREFPDRDCVAEAQQRAEEE